MKRFMADLHIHSALSPCGSLEMSPLKILEKAKNIGLDMIAITDHNAIENNKSLMKLASKYEINILHGMEVQTEEEIHILVYFDDYESLNRVWNVIYANLPDIKNNPLYFGDQIVVDENENIIKFEEKLLLNSSKISLGSLCKLVREYNGLAIPAHINSSIYSIISQIGFIPENLFFSFLELSYECKKDSFIRSHQEMSNYKFISFSDAHYLKDIGRAYTIFEINKPTISELKLASLDLKDRRVLKIMRRQ
jgi:PHP family Zn ribbon phosphoesterase